MAEADPSPGPSRPRPDIFVCLPKELDTAKQQVRTKIIIKLHKAAINIKLKITIHRSNLLCCYAILEY